MSINVHVIIPDLQLAPADDTLFVEWIGRYAVDHTIDKPDWTTTFIQLGDLGDFNSLSWYDRGKKVMEGERVEADIAAYNDGLARLSEPLEVANSKRRRKYRPRLVLLDGNHEERLDRHAEANPQIDSVGTHRLDRHGWEAVPFLEPLNLDGVMYAHYFYNPSTGRPYGGQNAETRLKTIGHSFTQGHQQGLLTGVRPTIAGLQRALVAGSAYPKNPRYLGPQTHNHWRGILVCHQVHDGNYNLMEVDLDYLAARYGKTTLDRYRKDKGIL
ncbi:MAG TPA: hypothetical protein VNM39_10800 [Verrucomicrobiae bacterium]|nr:hypothetical protein [Verrucomicrobiae bacterium]